MRLPLKEPFAISSGVTSDRRILLLELVESSGASVFSECVAGERPNYSEETVDTAWLAIRRWLAPRILGRDVADPREVADVLDREVRGHRMAKAALEMGVWAMDAVLRGESLSRRLGGTRDRVATGISLGLEPTPEALVEKAVAARRAGYRRIKLKIAPGADVAYVRAVRAALGPHVPLTVDANAAYTLADLPTFEALDAFGCAFVEQPLAADRLLDHARLQAAIRTPVCLDESVTGVARAEEMIALGAGRVVNLKPGRVGGFAASLAVHDLCAAHGVPVWCGGMLESGIGRAYNVALASLPNFTLPGDLSPSARYWARDLVEPEWTMDSEGWVRVPRDEPGLGVAVDVERVEALAVRRAVCRAQGARR